MRVRQARIVDGIVAALALIVASWPLTTLLQSGEWIRPVLLFIGLAAVIGMLGRAAGLRGWQVLTSQLVLIVLTMSWVYGRGHLWHGLPQWETIQAADALVADAVHTIVSFTAPAPVTPGILFVTGGLMAVIAVLVDYLAVTRQSPALAGLPLLVTFLVSAANSGSSLNAVYFVALALAWLVMLARQGTSLLVRWSSLGATPTTPARDTGDDHGASAHAALARSLGVVTLALAVTLPALLPQLPPHYLASGLGRSEGSVGGTASVGFTQTLDLRVDLASRSTTPVLTFRTDDPTPPPLRVAASSVYDGAVWRPTPEDRPDTPLSANHHLPTPAGLSSTVSRTPYHLTVEANDLRQPQLAVPFPLAAADLGGISWGVTKNDSVLVARRPTHYSTTYLEVAPTGDLPTDLSDGASPPIAAANLQVDPRSARRVRSLAASVVGDEQSPVGKAVLIQNYLRDPSRFTYSLTLAPAVRGPDGNKLDPISQFLVTKRGYCTQFASAMIMMARAEGIPARMGVGFLPGDKDANGVYHPTAAQAHAWPELAIPGLGWTRFEPTPAVRSGEPPPYALTVPAAAVPGGRPLDEKPPAAAPKPVAPAPKPALDGPSAASAPAVASLGQRLRQRLPLVLLTLAFAVLAALVVPVAGRYRRAAGRPDPIDRAGNIEAEWAAFVSRLSDYGIAEPGLRTPQEMERFYEREITLDLDASKALVRTTQTLERSRYAAPTDEPLSIQADTHQLVHAVAATRSPAMRVRATLWPRSGIEQLNVWTTAAVDALFHPVRTVQERHAVQEPRLFRTIRERVSGPAQGRRRRGRGAGP